MKTSTHYVARRFAMTLLAIFMTATSWAQLQGTGKADDPYLISSAADWATFTERINGGTGTTAYYQLTADITLGTPENPINTIVGTDNKNFRGVFDGDFHTLLIYMNRTEKYAAPFGVTDGATIKNLKVEGEISTINKFAAGIVAYANNRNSDKRPTRLINCVSSIHITCDGIETVISEKPYDCTHGGLVGQNETGTLKFENCVFDGWIKEFATEKKANKCTGFVAWVNNNVVYNDCVMAGVIDVKPNDATLANSMANYHRLSASAKPSMTNLYYLVDYTYSTMTVQGDPAPTTLPENVISRKYTINDVDYYVPEVKINENDLTYYNWKLTEGTDYIINTVGGAHPRIEYIGINNYAGKYVINIPPVFQMSIDTWDDTEKSGWYALSSPVDGQEFESTTNLTSPVVKHNIYRYNEEKRLWEEYRNEANQFDRFENGRGYLYRTEYNGGEIGFNGTLNSGDVKIDLSYTSKEDKMSGFNLIGNPYSHDIYKSVAIPNDILITGYSVLTEEGTWEYKTDKEAIKEGTAVLVQTVSDAKGDYTITMFDTDNAPSAKDSNDDIWFTVKNSQYSDVAHVEFTEGEGFHKMPHYNGEAPMLYVRMNGEDFASANVSEGVKSFDLCFETKAMSQYTLTFNRNGNYDYLHLIDRMTGADVDMLIEDEYTFIGSSNDNAERFIVRLGGCNDNNTIENATFAWQSGTNVVIDGEGELQVFDVTGRMVMNVIVSGMENINLSNGVYVLRLLGDGVKTQKVVVR